MIWTLLRPWSFGFDPSNVSDRLNYRYSYRPWHCDLARPSPRPRHDVTMYKWCRRQWSSRYQGRVPVIAPRIIKCSSPETNWHGGDRRIMWLQLQVCPTDGVTELWETELNLTIIKLQKIISNINHKVRLYCGNKSRLKSEAMLLLHDFITPS